ncbi:MAG TPA: glycerate kinase [Acidimicrobiales bacterium]|nr:glycerate kinase [Acidimicrobiales bacterium]
MADPPRLVLAAPDAFKGTASAAAVAAAVAEGATAAGWASDRCPLSDGGEGFADVLTTAPGSDPADPGRWNEATVTGPLGLPVVARWYLHRTRAVIESAAASGLPLAGGAAGNDPVGATSRGTGELIVAAVAAGARRVLLGVGGSATTDGGLGAVEAIDEAGGLGGVEVVVACDVETLFVDAAALFGPQKGASPEQVVILRRRLEELADRYRTGRGVDVAALAGSGAAGGLAGGLAALGARLVPGFDVVAEAVDLGPRLARSDLVVTGEGRLDTSSWSGKVVGGLRRLARRTGTPVLVVAGVLGPGGAVPDLEVVDLTALYGESRALAEPAACVADAVRLALSQR